MKHTFNTKKSIEDIGNTAITPIRFKDQKESGVYLSEKGKMIVIGLRPVKKVTRRKLILLMRRAVRMAREARAGKLAFDLSDLNLSHLELQTEEVAELFATSAEMANYEFTTFKEKPEDGWPDVHEIVFVGELSTKVKSALRRGKIIGEEVNKARALSNTPGGHMTPAVLAKKAQESVKNLPVKVKVLSEKDMHKLKMGGVLAVAQGSAQTPRFIIMEYMGGSKIQKPAVLVGKGVTFDTGGINIKPEGPSTNAMIMDMAGGAAVIQAIALAARLKIKKNIIGLVPAVENMVSGSSFRP